MVVTGFKENIYQILLILDVYLDIRQVHQLLIGGAVYGVLIRMILTYGLTTKDYQLSQMVVLF